MPSAGPTTTGELADLCDPDSYRGERTLKCDLVMKGGITSGVIYPRAVCQLATTRQLQRIGGTSAGAIAAAAAAAAEYGRNTASRDAGFPRLAGLPARLAEPVVDGHTRLFHLFQAQAATERLYRLVAVLIGRGGKVGKGLRAIIPALGTLRPLPGLLVPATALVGVVVPAVLLAGAINHGGAWRIAGAAGLLVLGIVVFLVGTAAAIGCSVVLRLMRDVPGNGFGLCSGMGGPGGKHPPLTEWLADEFDRIAGKPAGSDPLTFGDLNRRGITLSMLTTDLSAGTQNELPFGSQVWAFSPGEFAELFPQRIVEWLKNHPAPVESAPAELLARFKAKGLCPMPRPEHLPVIVAVRMSLSFPMLLSTVPLHAVDYTRANQPIVRHRFSDGGITSNFPIDFFDAAIPGHPTFGINLVTVGTLDPVPGDNVSIPDTNSEGILPPANDIGKLTQFVHALANTMQNWSDSMQTRVPGYRDRIIAVNHTESEGGLNLDMDSGVVEGLAERGRYVGRCADNFDFVNHRWVRLRSMLQTLEAFVSPAAKTLDAGPPHPEIPTYREMMAGSPPPSYRRPTIARAGPTVVNAIVGLADAYESVLQDGETSRFQQGAPRPLPRLAIRPQP